MRQVSLITVALWLGLASVAGAQDRRSGDRADQVDREALAEWVRPGDEIRLSVTDAAEPSTGPRGPLTGWLAAISDDSLTLRLEGRQYMRLPVGSIRDLEVKRKGGATTGAVVGGLVGVGVGVAVLLTSVEQDCDEQFLSDLCDASNAMAYAAPLVFGVGGLLVGRWIGGLIAPARWERVPFQKLVVYPTANGQPGIALRFTIGTDL